MRSRGRLRRASASLEVFVAPGNAGTAREPKVQNVAIDVLDFAGLCRSRAREDVGFTIVGPEVPLVAGIRDYFDARGLPCFGPSQAAAQLEGSKAFTKSFLERHRIPTAAYRTFTDLAAAEAYVRERGVPIVVKADGLAAGKGVVVARTARRGVGGRARDAVRRCVRRRRSSRRHRRLPRRRRSELHLHCRRSSRGAVREFAGSQGARRWRSRPEYRRAWALIRRRRCHSCVSTSGSWRK